MIAIEHLFLVAALLLLLSIVASKLSDKYGVPALLLFLIVGMLAGSEGPGGIHFDDPQLVQSIGVTALAFILFAGGADTKWSEVRSVSRRSFMLATLGVAVMTLVTGLAASWALGVPLGEGLLLGAIVSSTDAAAVFSVLRSRNIGLPPRVRHLLELESGSNDPMAVFLTLAFIFLLQQGSNPFLHLTLMFLQQMAFGAVLGLALGWLLIFSINHIGLETEGLYPVLTLSSVLLIYGLISFAGGNGFLGIYVAGLVMGDKPCVHKKSLLRFHDAVAWLMQIAMFLILGLQVFPSELVPVLGEGLLLSAVLMLAARPLAVFICLTGSQFAAREKLLISWVGLRGAVPIILATFPLLAGVANANYVFNVVFFIVLTSVLLQGTTIPLVARRLGLAVPSPSGPQHPLEFEQRAGTDVTLMDFIVPYQSPIAGKTIVEIDLPDESVITLICRDSNYIVPTGTTLLQPGDVLLVLLNQTSIAALQAILSGPKGS